MSNFTLLFLNILTMSTSNIPKVGYMHISLNKLPEQIWWKGIKTTSTILEPQKTISKLNEQRVSRYSACIWSHKLETVTCYYVLSRKWWCEKVMIWESDDVRKWWCDLVISIIDNYRYIVLITYICINSINEYQATLYRSELNCIPYNETILIRTTQIQE